MSSNWNMRRKTAPAQARWQQREQKNLRKCLLDMKYLLQQERKMRVAAVESRVFYKTLLQKTENKLQEEKNKRVQLEQKVERLEEQLESSKELEDVKRQLEEKSISNLELSHQLRAYELANQELQRTLEVLTQYWSELTPETNAPEMVQETPDVKQETTENIEDTPVVTPEMLDDVPETPDIIQQTTIDCEETTENTEDAPLDIPEVSDDVQGTLIDVADTPEDTQETSKDIQAIPEVQDKVQEKAPKVSLWRRFKKALTPKHRRQHGSNYGGARGSWAHLKRT